MFRDHETAYVIASVSLAWLFTLTLVAYEVFVNTADTRMQTAAAAAYGVGDAVGMTLLAVGTWEVIMVLARRREKRLAEQARQEGLEQGLEQGRREAAQESERRWKAWYDDLPQEVRDRQPPPPSSE